MTAPQHPDPLEDDRRFEDDVRRALRREAASPAPDRLVARIAASRRESTSDTRGRSLVPHQGPSLRAWGAGFATVAAAAAILVALALRPPVGPAPSVVGATASPQGSGPATTAPSVAPSSAEASVPASSAPAGPVAIGAVPADFNPVSATFVSADDGWLLGHGPCTSSTGAAGSSGSGPSGSASATSAADCASIARTTDAGRTWQLVPAPSTTVAPAPEANGGVSALRFADALDGWAFGPELWATHDGGATWQRVAFPVRDATIMSLETSSGVVHAAFFDAVDAGTVRIASSDVATDAWTLSKVRVQLGAGPVPQPQIVLHGSVGWLVEVDRTVVDGARLSGSEWTSWTPPCKSSNGPASLAAASDTTLVAACNVGLWSNPSGVHYYTSADGGSSFRSVGGRLPVADLQEIAAAPSTATVVVAGSIGAGTALVASFDGGTTWSTVLPAAGGTSISNLGFTTADQGVAIVASDGGASALVMTRDGGRTWQSVALGS